jgi:peptidyl-tRNA hydrolase
VKVGIGRPAQRGEVINHVLSRFTPDELPLIEAACTEAAEQLLKLLESALSRHA